MTTNDISDYRKSDKMRRIFKFRDAYYFKIFIQLNNEILMIKFDTIVSEGVSLCTKGILLF